MNFIQLKSLIKLHYLNSGDRISDKKAHWVAQQIPDFELMTVEIAKGRISEVASRLPSVRTMKLRELQRYLIAENPQCSQGQAKAAAKRLVWMRENINLTDKQFTTCIERLMKEVPSTGTLQNNVRYRA